ncbi:MULTISPECIES: hypothetical protein [Flavobacterium]|uniref:Uncharacterized protein n=1 Tax=Flavobacterium weaverense TaxID=271156 RepID=A0A3L9ZJK5_9FLAO|nr:hypothetical protein [Flavobacterium weaverense]RMA72756.1 hypothetical protein BC961_2821 [Flavobacterium weaverense]
MKNNHTNTLNEAIELLKLKRADELMQLKDQYHYTYESFKPINLIKKTIGQMAQSQEFKTNLLSNVVGLATGYISRKVIVGSTHSPMKKILGTVFQLLVTKVVANQTEKKIDKEMQNN